MAEAASPAESLEDKEDLLAVLCVIAERAGKEILAHYVETEEIEVRHKADDSPVTEADEAAEAFILEALAKLTPEIPVVSEEAASAGHVPDVSGGRFWLVDPLDGTKEFLSRNGEFTVNIALVVAGVPVAGVVHAPALAMTWAGAMGAGAMGAGAKGAEDPGAPEGAEDRESGPALATFSQTDLPPTAIAARAIPPEGATVVASRRHGSGAELDEFLAGYQVKEQVSAGSSLKFCLVATAKADLYPRFGRTMEWDTAAGHAVLRAAGGKVLTQEGAPLAYGKPGFENPHFIAYGKG